MSSPLGQLVWERLVASETIEVAPKRARSVAEVQERLAEILSRGKDVASAAVAILDYLMDAPVVIDVFGDEETIAELLRDLERGVGQTRFDTTEE